jgi:hypothetical protein
VAEVVVAAGAPVTEGFIAMSTFVMIVAVAIGIVLVILTIHDVRTRASAKGKGNSLSKRSADIDDSLLLTTIVDGNSSHDSIHHEEASHPGTCEAGSHDSGGLDCGSHSGFDSGGHH